MNTDDQMDLPEAFRAAMARVCSSVSVVTALDGARPHGTTVSAFASLSMSPPMVLVSLDSGSDLLALVRQTGRFGLNVLAGHQSGLAVRFATKGPDKFAGIPWTTDHGVARLPEVASWTACRVASLVPGGDHVVVLGEVEAADSSPAEPLTYYARTFGTHAQLAEPVR